MPDALLEGLVRLLVNRLRQSRQTIHRLGIHWTPESLGGEFLKNFPCVLLACGSAFRRIFGKESFVILWMGPILLLHRTFNGQEVNPHVQLALTSLLVRRQRLNLESNL